MSCSPYGFLYAGTPMRFLQVEKNSMFETKKEEKYVRTCYQCSTCCDMLLGYRGDISGSMYLFHHFSTYSRLI